MTPFINLSRKSVALAGVAALAFGAGATAQAEAPDGAALQVHSHAIQGNVVVVALVNHGTEALSGTVSVQAIAGDGQVVGSNAPFHVEEGQKIFVEIPLPASDAEEVIDVGVVLDDGAPF